MQFGSNSLQHNNKLMYMKQIYVYALAHTVNGDNFFNSIFTIYAHKLAQFFLWSLIF